MEDARAMMDSPVRRAFDYAKDEKPETLKAYEPEVGANDLLDKTYYYGNRFGRGLLLARRLVESGARYIQVEYQYGAFKGFDMHESGRTRMIEMKRQVDRPIAQLIKDLDERGLLDRTLVMISTEFGRTIASDPAAGKEPDGFAERHTGEKLVIENEKDVWLPRPFQQRQLPCLLRRRLQERICLWPDRRSASDAAGGEPSPPGRRARHGL